MKKRITSFKYAIRGIGRTIKSEKNMQIHLVVAFLVIVAGVLLSINLTEWLLCLLCFAMVISAELFNSAIENVVDLISPQHHKLAGKAKDIAAGAVLITAIFAAIIGLVIFVPKLLDVLLSR